MPELEIYDEATDEQIVEENFQEFLGQVGVVIQVGKGDLGFDHPELGQVPAGVRVLRPECAPSQHRGSGLGDAPSDPDDLLVTLDGDRPGDHRIGAVSEHDVADLGRIRRRNVPVGDLHEVPGIQRAVVGQVQVRLHTSVDLSLQRQYIVLVSQRLVPVG